LHDLDAGEHKDGPHEIEKAAAAISVPSEVRGAYRLATIPTA